MRRGRQISVSSLGGTIPNESSATSPAPTSSWPAPSPAWPSIWQGPCRPWSSTTAALSAVSPDRGRGRSPHDLPWIPRISLRTSSAAPVPGPGDSGAQRCLDRLRNPAPAGFLPDAAAHGLDDRPHGSSSRDTLLFGAGDLLRDDGCERLVTQFGRQVGSEDVGLGPLARRQFVPSGRRE